MSIVIERARAAGAGANTSDTNTEAPEGPGHFWAGLRIQCPVWKTKDLGTTTGGSLFTVGEEYVTGYLVPKLNGVAQDPTRFSETDKTLGTFTFDVAPDSGWGATVDYGVYCDEDLALQIPTKQGSGLPKKVPGTVGQGNGQGIRAAVAGTSGGAPRFAWTENILATSPTWTANTTGLPGTATVVNNLRVDPFNPGTTAYLNVDNILYKNTAYRTAGSWTSVFDPPGAGVIGSVQLSIASPGLVVVLHGDPTGAGGDDLVVSHSHDSASTFTSIYVSDAAISTYPDRLRRVLVGQWDASFFAASWSSIPFDFGKSTDTGHVWSNSVEFPADTFHLMLPYPGNSNQQEIFAYRSADIYRSTNQGGSFALYSSPAFTVTTVLQLDVSSNNINVIWGFDHTQNRMYKSVDKALTFTTLTPATSVYDAALLRDVRWFLAGEQVTANGKYVQTSEDLVTFTNRTGDLITGVFTGATPLVRAIVVDWTT